MVPVVDLDTQHADRCEVTQELWGHDAVLPPGQRVRDHRDTAGGDDELDRAHRVGRIVTHVVRTVIAEEPREGLVPVIHDTSRDQGIGQMGPTQRRPLSELDTHLIDRDRYAVRGQPLNHPIHPGQPGLSRLRQLGLQGRVVGRRQVAEQMDALPLTRARDLDPTHESYPELGGGLCCLVPSGSRVVVSESDNVQPGPDGLRHHLGRSLGPVADIGMGVEIDQHASAWHVQRRGIKTV